MNDPTMLTRRQAIARAASLLGGAISATTVAGVLAGCARPLHAAPQARVLTDGRRELVATIAEHILPETDTPGARAAGVHDFIEAMLADYYPEEARTRFLEGLARLEARVQRAYQDRFLALAPEQQLEVVHVHNQYAYEERPGAAYTGSSAKRSALLNDAWGPEDVGRGSFFRTLKELVVVGYYTSEIGATQELRANPMGLWRGDVPYAEIGRAYS